MRFNILQKKKPVNRLLLKNIKLQFFEETENRFLKNVEVSITLIGRNPGIQNLLNVPLI